MLFRKETKWPHPRHARRESGNVNVRKSQLVQRHLIEKRIMGRLIPGELILAPSL